MPTSGRVNTPGEWYTAEYQRAADTLADPQFHDMQIQIAGPSGCGHHEPTSDADTLERHAREIGPDATFSLVTSRGKFPVPLGPPLDRGDGEEQEPRGPGCVTRRMADIEPQPVRWLFRGYIPLGKLTILAGDPGLGKSYLSMDFAARTSSGCGWPTEPGQQYEPSTVVILNAEDDAHDTIRPRLDALEADVQNIYIVDGVLRTVESDQPAHLSLAADLSFLEATIAAKRARLVIIDPLSAYLGRVDSHRDAEVRSILSPLRDLAERQGVAVLAIMHLNKSANTNAMQRAIGSVAFGAAARMMWLVTRDPDDDSRRLLLPAKSNLKDQGTGLAFVIDEAGQVKWDSTPVNKSANQVLEELATSNSQARDDAQCFLRDTLAGGPVESDEVKRLAKEAGIKGRTLWRAKKELGVKALKNGMIGGWEWSL